MLDLEVRCSVAVFRDDEVLLVHRTRPRLDDWVLPGGSPLPGEALGACARRELAEETGLDVELRGCGLLVEALDPNVGERILDVVFVAAEPAAGIEPSPREAGLQVVFVPLTSLDGLRMRPALGPSLQRLRSDRGAWGSYLDDVHPWDMALDLGESGLLDRP
jgi:ADP-ribose pyrophosphatase YjhB (NUDIX family)